MDNLIIHEVLNPSDLPRVHLVIDVAEKAMPRRKVLKPGQTCRYTNSLRSSEFMTATC